jgi:phthalate 4,5-dioxygenase oxygenase subunit
MIPADINARITRVAPGTPCGGLLRQYWQPAALLDEFDGPRPVRPVKLLGQDFVLFRDQAGRFGMLDRDCPHRGADLAFGRLEDGGLRCAFHGWLFDADGTCLETPAEPEGSTLCTKIRQRAYPVAVRGGIVWAWLGEGAPPAFPALDCFVAPDQYTFTFKGRIACNWLQALEVGIDPAHASFLHRFFEDEDAAEGYGKQFRASSADSDIPMTRLLREFDRPRIEVEATDFGLRIAALRQLSQANMHVRVTNLVFPQAIVIPMSATMTISQWHVPVDDVTTYWYAIFTAFDAPVDKARMRAQRLELYELPDYVPRKGAHNDYGFDAHEQAHRTYTGMGEDINVHDQWAVESQGPIQDRTRENLASSDKAIAANRRLLLRAIAAVEKGEAPSPRATAATITGPAAIDGIGPTETWQSYWPEVDAKRRAASPWARPGVPRAA